MLYNILCTSLTKNSSDIGMIFNHFIILTMTHISYVVGNPHPRPHTSMKSCYCLAAGLGNKHWAMGTVFASQKIY